MVRRSSELAGLPFSSTEDVRAYGRECDRLLGDIAADIECRGHEIRGKVIALLKQAAKEGVGDGKQKGMKAARISIGYVQAAISVRIARHGVRVVYATMEKIIGPELRGLRDRKYGKGKYKAADEPLDV
mgnify:CR=1 FL=1